MKCMPMVNTLSSAAPTYFMPGVAELIGAMMRRLRDERGWTRSDLSFRTVRVGYAGMPEPSIEALETRLGTVPAAETIEALAAAFELPPETFYEYPIAVARASRRAREREAQELRAEAERSDEHRGNERDTKRPPRRRKEQEE